MAVLPTRCGARRKSVCALLVEGAGRQPGSDAEFRRYVTMAMGSADEARLWCRYAADLGYVAIRDRALAGRPNFGQSRACCKACERSLSEH